MTLTAPLFISARLMAAASVGDDGSKLHIAPHGVDHDDRVVWRYVIEDGNRTVLDEGNDLRSGAGDPIDPRKAMGSLVSFLSTAAEAYRAGMQGRASENADLFPPEVAEWAYMHDDDLAALGLDLEEPEMDAPGPPPSRGPFLRPIGHGDPVPPGWVAETIGQWNGRETEVLYDPGRQDVIVVPTSMTEDREGALVALGWSYEGTDGFAVMWVRDRISAIRTRLDRTVDALGHQADVPARDTGPPPPEIGGR